jgi:phosphotransferase system enzyme I (PtsI)
MGATQASSEIRWRGIAAAPGVALGPAFIYRVAHDEPPIRHLNSDEIPDTECSRLDAALTAVREDLLRLKKESPSSVGSALAKIFDAQVMIVDDPSICAQVKAAIHGERLAAESAFARVVGEAQRTIERSPDPYLREMANDIDGVKIRVIDRLMGYGGATEHLSGPAIILADTITPADIISLKRGHILGIVTQTGGQTSHTALLAKSLGIPAVAGLGIDMRTARPGVQVVVDGFSGVVFVNPDADTVEFYQRKRRRAHSPWPKKLEALRELPAVTRDRRTVSVMANIDLPGEAELVVASGAAGVGLYRTEYLFLQKGGYPSESRQVDVYREAVRTLAGRPLVVRTFDLGSDKAARDAPPEANPALGVRGLRLSFERPSALAMQYRALLTASTEGPIWVMVPMVAAVEEFEAALELWNQIKRELKGRKTQFDPNTKFGLMIETPAAVLMATELAAKADFLSIGSNDLLQYTIAVDRGNQRLASMQHPWHPSLWREIASTVTAGHRSKIPVGICGEMSGNPYTVPVLLGLGIDSFSIHPNSIPRVKALVRQCTYAECRRLAEKVCEARTAPEVLALVKSFHDRVERQGNGTSSRATGSSRRRSKKPTKRQ